MNPFSSCFVRSECNHYRFAADDSNDQALREQCFSAIAQAFERSQRIAIIGPHGTGKSTLLHDLHPELASRFRSIDWLRLTNEPAFTRRLFREFLQSLLRTNASSSRCLVIDGYEQLNWFERMRLKRLASVSRHGVIITSHRDQRGFVTAHRTAWNHEISRRLTAEKLNGLPSNMQSKLLASYLDKVNDQRTGSLNLRELWFMMYDEAERLRKVSGSYSPQNDPYHDACSS